MGSDAAIFVALFVCLFALLGYGVYSTHQEHMQCIERTGKRCE